MTDSLHQQGIKVKAIPVAVMTLACGLSSSAWPQAASTHEHVRIAPQELDAELTRIANDLTSVSDGKSNLARLYLIMQDACRTAVENGAYPLSGSIPKALQENYCTCDALLTIDDWLKNSDMKQRLVAFNGAPDAAGARLILANHKIHEHDPVCGAAFGGAN